MSSGEIGLEWLLPLILVLVERVLSSLDDVFGASNNSRFGVSGSENGNGELKNSSNSKPSPEKVEGFGCCSEWDKDGAESVQEAIGKVACQADKVAGPATSFVEIVLIGTSTTPSLVRLSCLRPGRLVMRYSQRVPLLAQREHVGFSFVHLTFDAAQPWQLSRSLEAFVVVKFDR